MKLAIAILIGIVNAGVCTPGQFIIQNPVTSKLCDACPIGQTSQGIQYYCDPCPPGSYCPDLGGKVLLCPAGTSSPAGSTAAKACQTCSAPGTFAASAGSVCTACPSNSVPSPSRTACIGTCSDKDVKRKDNAFLMCDSCNLGKVSAYHTSGTSANSFIYGETCLCTNQFAGVGGISPCYKTDVGPACPDNAKPYFVIMARTVLNTCECIANYQANAANVCVPK